MNYTINVRHKAVTKSVARSQIKSFKHEDYVLMYNGKALTNVVNRRSSSNHHQVRQIISISICMTAHLTIFCQVITVQQKKCRLCPFDDKQYLFPDMPDGRPNFNTHAYGNCDLAAEENLVVDEPEPGA